MVLFICRHLIGFFLFLSLTIYTVMKVPAVVDIPTLQNLPSVLRKADFQKLRTDLTTCLPSLRHMRDWHIMAVLSNCLPERFSHINHTDVCVLVLLVSLVWIEVFIMHFNSSALVYNFDYNGKFLEKTKTMNFYDDIRF